MIKRKIARYAIDRSKCFKASKLIQGRHAELLWENMQTAMLFVFWTLSMAISWFVISIHWLRNSCKLKSATWSKLSGMVSQRTRIIRRLLTASRPATLLRRHAGSHMTTSALLWWECATFIGRGEDLRGMWYHKFDGGPIWSCSHRECICSWAWGRGPAFDCIRDWYTWSGGLLGPYVSSLWRGGGTGPLGWGLRCVTLRSRCT